MARTSRSIPTPSTTTVRLHSPAWVLPVRFTVGEGFTGNDGLVVRHLNALAVEHNVTDCDAALVLARTEYVGIEPIDEDPIAEVEATVVATPEPKVPSPDEPPVNDA